MVVGQEKVEQAVQKQETPYDDAENERAAFLFGEFGREFLALRAEFRSFFRFFFFGRAGRFQFRFEPRFGFHNFFTLAQRWEHELVFFVELLILKIQIDTAFDDRRVFGNQVVDCFGKFPEARWIFPRAVARTR